MRKFKIKRQLQKDLNYRLIAKALKGRLNKAPENGEKQILFPFFTSGDNIFLLINMLITFRLQNKGYRGIFIICDENLPICTNERINKTRKEDKFLCKNCYRPYHLYAKVIGADFLRLSDFIDPDFIRKIQIEIDKCETLEDCRSFELQGIKVGAFAEKSVMRFFLTGKLEECKEHVVVYKKFLSSLAHISSGWSAIMEKIKSKPELVVLYNGTLSFESYIREFCMIKKIDYITHETYVGQNSWIYKKNDEVMKLTWTEQWKEFNKGKLDNRQIQKAKEFIEGLRYGKQMYAKLNDPTPLKTMIEEDGEFAVLFTNLNFDTAVLGRNPHFNSMEDWINQVIDYWIERHISIKLIIRIHPGEVKLITPSADFIGPKIKDKIKGSPNIILFDAMDKVDSYTLIEHMKFGLIYSSTIGLEISYLNKLCLIAGDAFYKHEDFVSFPKDRADYFVKLEAMTKEGACLHNNSNKRELLKFIYFIYFHRVKRLKGINMDHTNHVNLFSFETIEELNSMNNDVFEEFEAEVLNR
tara:strand:+ start:380 stop:1957 length:1578 start_codon:yes stop_codon:yes gene_type:complete